MIWLHSQLRVVLFMWRNWRWGAVIVAVASARRIEGPTLTSPHCSVVSFRTTGYHACLRTRRGRHFATPMDFLSHINLREMLGDLTVTAFLILLAASVVVVSTMVLFPLIDLAFEKKPVARPHNDLIADDESWRAGRPWLLLRLNFLRQLMSDLPQNARRGHLTLVHGSGQGSESRHWTSLIKRTNTATQKDANLNTLINEFAEAWTHSQGIGHPKYGAP
jgi:hypothetical protein